MNYQRMFLFHACLFLLMIVSLPAVAQQEYVIGEGDLLKVTVYDQPDLTIESRVSGDGKISFPLIGEVVVNNRTVADAEKTIEKRLAAGYIVKPQVHIFITEYKSKKVTVLGEVMRPGLVFLRGASTLMEVLSDAGGITPNAGDTIVIQRKPVSQAAASQPRKSEKDAANSEVAVVIETKKLFDEGDRAANVPVLPGDSIYVPKAAFVYLNGEVKTPGAYKITKGLTVIKAITIAGGFTIKASEGRTKIIRKTEKGEKEYKARMDDLVMPDDMIYVPESWF